MAERPRHSTGARLTMPLIALAVGAAALGIYWDHTYTGPYRWLAELQLKWFGVYEKTFTFLLAFAIVLAPIGAVVGMYRVATRGKRRELAGGAPATDANKGTAPQAAPVVAGSGLDRYFVPGVILLIAMALGIMAVYQWQIARNAGDLVHATVEQYEGGQNPGAWVHVTGRPLVEQMMTTDSQGAREHYIPIVSEDWQEGRPVFVFVEVRESSADAEALRAAAKEGYSGMASKGGLPGMVRVAFEREGLPPAAEHYMIKFGRTPADERRIARDAGLFSGGLAVLGVGWFLGEQYRARRAMAANEASSARALPQHRIKAIVTVDAPADPSKRV